MGIGIKESPRSVFTPPRVQSEIKVSHWGYQKGSEKPIDQKRNTHI